MFIKSVKVLHSNQNNGQQLLNCVGEHQKDRNRNKRIAFISIPIILLYMFQGIATSYNYSSWHILPSWWQEKTVHHAIQHNVSQPSFAMLLAKQYHV